MMRILHIVAGLPPEGGISESVPQLCRQLKMRGHAVTIVTLDEPMSRAALESELAGVQFVRCRASRPFAIFFSLQMFRQLRDLCAHADIVHVHSQWTFPVWYACHLALKYKKPLVMTPRGCLAKERLKISALKKMVAGLFFDRRYLKKASVVQATSEQEASDIADYLKPCSVNLLSRNIISANIKNPKVVIIPNGVDVSKFKEFLQNRDMIDSEWPECLNKRIYLYLSRIHRIKGIEYLIEAWSRVLKKLPQSQTSDCILLIAGSGEKNYERILQRQVDIAGMHESIKFIGSVFGEKKINLLKCAEVLVLPSKNENFGIVVAEALACGVPVITTRGAPWSELMGSGGSELSAICGGSELSEGSRRSAVRDAVTGMVTPKKLNTPNSLNQLNSLPPAANGRCGWWVDVGVEPLAEALREAMDLTDEERQVLGQNGRKLVEQKYQWCSVAKQMIGIYDGIVKSGR